MSNKIKPLKEIMFLAINEAQKAKDAGDYPVGAVVAKENVVIASAGNRSKRYEDPTLHAEILAIQFAARSIGRQNLEDCVIYTTHEPCIMCTGAIVYSRIKGIIFGANLDDIRESRLRHNHHNRSWRTMNIRAKDLLRDTEKDLTLIEGFMRMECKKLFYIL